MALPLPKLTPERYLAIEREADYKSEYYRGEMFAMAGGTGKHADLSGCLNRISGSIAESVGDQVAAGN